MSVSDENDLDTWICLSVYVSPIPSRFILSILSSAIPLLLSFELMLSKFSFASIT